MCTLTYNKHVQRLHESMCSLDVQKRHTNEKKKHPKMLHTGNTFQQGVKKQTNKIKNQQLPVYQINLLLSALCDCNQ